MAFLISLKVACKACGRTATKQLYDWTHAPLSKYCNVCGDRALAAQQKEEKQSKLKQAAEYKGQ